MPEKQNDSEADGVDRVTSSSGAEHVDELGYPRKDLETLLATSEDQYRGKVDEFGAGKNWLEPSAPEARWHIWKACDELFQARDCAHLGWYDPATRRFADALNHMLMAMERTRHEGCVIDLSCEHCDNDAIGRFGGVALCQLHASVKGFMEGEDGDE